MKRCNLSDLKRDKIIEASVLSEAPNQNSLLIVRKVELGCLSPSFCSVL